MKVRDVLKNLRKEGSHRQLTHPTKSGIVTVASSEFRYGFGQACELLNFAVEASADGGRNFLANAKHLLVNLVDDEQLQPYVASFCNDHGDRLSQWRAYGDGGAGFAIGFGFPDLREHFGGSIRIIPVTYCRATQQEILSETIEGYQNAFQRALSRWPTLAKGIEECCRCNLVSLLLVEFATF